MTNEGKKKDGRVAPTKAISEQELVNCNMGGSNREYLLQLRPVLNSWLIQG
jgi:hypothetical protein